MNEKPTPEPLSAFVPVSPDDLEIRDAGETQEAAEIEAQDVSRNRRTRDMTQADADAALDAIPANNFNGKIGPFYALTFPNYRLFFYGQLISVAGTWMQDVAQKWLVWDLTHKATWLGLVSGANAVPFVVFAVWGGQIADRYSRRAILVWTQTIAMLLAFVLALLASHASPVPLAAWHVVLISGLSGIVNAFNMPAQQAFVTDMVDERAALSNAIALNSLRFNIARVLGPVLAGIALVRFGAASCFAINGLSFIAVIISLLLMRLPAFTPREKSGSVFDGFRYIWETHSVLRIIVLTGAASVLLWPLSTLYPVFATEFHKGEAGFSAMMAANGIGAALAGVALVSIGSRIPMRGKVYGGAILFCLSLLLISAAPWYYAVLACLILSGFAMIIFGISSQTKVQEDVPDALRGRVMAVYSLVFNGLFSIGGLEIGALAEPNHFGPRATLILNAALGLIITASLYAWSVAERKNGARRIFTTEATEEEHRGHREEKRRD